MKSRAATVAFYSAVALQPPLFVVRVLLFRAADVPAWLAIMTVAIAVATAALGIVGYFQTRDATRTGFTRSGLAVVLSFFFGLLALIELFNGTNVMVD